MGIEALKAVETLLREVGENPERDGLRETPRRVVKAWSEMTAGYQMDPAAILSVTFSQDEHPYGGIVLVRQVPFASLCEHHVLPFTGFADVAYIPGENGRIVGLSKLARLVDVYARRLQVQERMTSQIAEAIDQHLQPLGVYVRVQANHTCMSLRGACKTGVMVTADVRGLFKTDPLARNELMHLLG